MKDLKSRIDEFTSGHDVESIENAVVISDSNTTETNVDVQPAETPLEDVTTLPAGDETPAVEPTPAEEKSEDTPNETEAEMLSKLKGRIEDERNEVSVKCEKLIAFINSLDSDDAENATKVELAHVNLLKEQYDAMCKYVEILNKRISLVEADIVVATTSK